MKEIKAHLPTKYGIGTIHWFADWTKEHCCLVFWDVYGKDDVLCRVHSSCLTWDIFHSLKCDCWEQLDYALQEIGEKWGVLIYLSQEWRDIWLINKIKAYALQDEGYDTVEANEMLNLPVDNRDYKVVKEILESLRIKSIKLMTNNPNKVDQLKSYGIKIISRIPIIIDTNSYNEKYYKTKKEKMNHLF